MRNNIQLTDEQIEELFSAHFDVAITIDDLVFTRDTIEDFKTSRQKWQEKGILRIVDFIYLVTLPHEKTVKALVEIESVQVRKGQPRTNLCIADFGEVRACFNA